MTTDNLSATATLFGKDISTFKRDMGTFAKDIGIRLYENEENAMTQYQSKMAYFDELRNVGGNVAIMEASQKLFIDYMNGNCT